MFKFKHSAIALVAIILAIAVAGCGDDDKKKKDPKPVNTPPTVISTFPAAGATEVPVNTNVVARFSEPMLAASITTATFTLAGPGVTAVTGTVSYDAANRSATFVPTADLAASTLFTARVTVGATDLAGAPMSAASQWSFTTGTTADATAPEVTSTNPADLATSVPINQKITAVFSEQMNSATLTTTTFTLLDAGANPVSGSVSCPGTTATFTPTAHLVANMTYTARITIAATDLAGNALAGDALWSFETGASAASGPATVVLGTAGNFVILAKAGVSTTGVTAVTGNIGLSPAAGTFLTGFSETMDATNVFSTSAAVTGQLFAADYAPPTPSNLSTAVLDMQTAYDDAKNRVLPDFTELGAGNIDGMTLVPGLYKWGTSLQIPISVTIAGGPNDIWIFQIAQDLSVGNGAIVTLSGGALARNIFWQVTGQATLGTTADFKGVILCQTQIVLNTGAVMLGRALAQTAVTLDANAVTAP